MQLKNLKYIISALFILCAFLGNEVEGTTNQIDLKKVSQASTEIAKNAIPAVVYIEVKLDRGKLLSSGQKKGHSQEDFYQFFNDHFMEQFFGGQRQQEPQVQRGQASGFLISSDGYILTNNHAVRESEEIKVLLNDGREYAAKIVGQDKSTDIAVIKIEEENLPFLNLGDSDAIEVGEWVMAIGTPLGLQLQTSVSTGVVSAKGRDNLDLANIEDFIQTDAAINRGNSGGPLLNADGEVIGINTAIVTNMGTGGYMGIGFAIPSNITKHAMNQLIENGSVTRGFLGVQLQKVDNNLAISFGLEEVTGALVAEVAPNSPAKKAGLKQGDIIIECDDKAIKSINALKNTVSMMKPGEEVLLTVFRDNARQTIPIEIGNYPEKGQSLTEKIGFNVQTLSPEIAQQLGYLKEKGVVITEVKPGSAAHYVGLQKGTLIMKVNHDKVSTLEEFEQILEKAEDNEPLLFLVKQGGLIRFVSIKLS